MLGSDYTTTHYMWYITLHHECVVEHDTTIQSTIIYLVYPSYKEKELV